MRNKCEGFGHRGSAAQFGAKERRDFRVRGLGKGYEKGLELRGRVTELNGGYPRGESVRKQNETKVKRKKRGERYRISHMGAK